MNRKNDPNRIARSKEYIRKKQLIKVIYNKKFRALLIYKKFKYLILVYLLFVGSILIFDEVNFFDSNEKILSNREEIVRQVSGTRFSYRNVYLKNYNYKTTNTNFSIFNNGIEFSKDSIVVIKRNIFYKKTYVVSNNFKYEIGGIKKVAFLNAFILLIVILLSIFKFDFSNVNDRSRFYSIYLIVIIMLIFYLLT